MTQPFLKWAGGKRQLLSEIERHIPEKIEVYREPFVGGGAVFFHLAGLGRFRGAVLSDVNQELITTYSAVRDEVDGVISLLSEMRYDKDEYYERRANEETEPARIAARMIYLNRCGFNGLYRLNKSGKFNVPFGRYDNPTICNAEALKAASKALRGVVLVCCDYALACSHADPGDFVYLDPPYVPASETANFAQYHNSRFAAQEQQELAAALRDLGDRGVDALLSNSDTDVARELYAGLPMRTVGASRNINSKGAKRGRVGELLVYVAGKERAA